MINIILAFLFSYSVMASNWMTLSTIESKGVSGYSLRSDCERSGEQCLDVGADPEVIEMGLFSLDEAMEDDLESPIWATRSMVEPCSDELDCQMRMSALKCVDDRSAFYSIAPMEVWCNKILSYNQKPSGKKILNLKNDEIKTYKDKIESDKNESKAEMERKKLLKEKLKDFDKTKLTTIASLREFVAELVELLK